MRGTEREAETQAEGEAGSPWGTQDPGITTGAKGRDTQVLIHPGVPSSIPVLSRTQLSIVFFSLCKLNNKKEVVPQSFDLNQDLSLNLQSEILHI